MARATVNTLLSLDEYAAIMGLDPFEFNQFGAGFPDEATHYCNYVWFQFPFQQDHLSREEIARAIHRAEKMLADKLNFYPAPQFIAQEPIQALGKRGQYQWYYGRQYQLFQTRYLKVLGGGVLARTLIGTATVTYSDPDNDGIDELFTATIATTLTDVNEIALYFVAADRLNNPVAEQWRIRPIEVTIAAGIATITGHASILCKPVQTFGYNVMPLDVSDASNFATSVEVYRLYRDATQSGQAFWQPYDGCSEEPCDLFATNLTCLGDRNGAMGLVFIAYEDACCYGWRQADQATLNYLAGEPFVTNNRMREDYAQIVAYLATGLLPDLACGCERSDRIIAYWRYDVKEGNVAGDRNAPDLTSLEALSPFGFTRGALYAWNRIQELMQMQGLSI